MIPNQNPIFNQPMGQQMGMNQQMMNNQPMNNQPMMQQPMMQQPMGNPGMMNQFTQNPQRPMNPQMGNQIPIMNPTTYMQNAQKQAIDIYLFYCNINGLNSQDQNVKDQFFRFFLHSAQNNNNNNKGNNGSHMGMSNGIINGGNNYGNNMRNNVGNNMGSNTGNNIYVNNMNQQRTNVYTRHSNCKKLPEILPRTDKDIYIDDTKQNPNTNFFVINNISTINILFQTNTGLKALLKIPKNITIYQMLKMFTDRMGIQELYINNGLIFLFNGQNLIPYCNALVGQIFKDGMLVTVFDQNGVIGA